jgi:hypothetical protein
LWEGDGRVQTDKQFLNPGRRFQFNRNQIPVPFRREKSAALTFNKIFIHGFIPPSTNFISATMAA